VSLKIYNIAGQQVKTIREGNQKVGYYSVNWDGKDRDGKAVSSGIYFYRFVAQNLKSDSQEYSATRKIVFFK
jgi:flagellar hook assembly protein FlgD